MIDGELIRKRRLELGLSQEQLASDVDISDRQMRRIESGAQPRPETARRIAKALGVSLGALITRRGRLPAAAVPHDIAFPNGAKELANAAVQHESDGDLELAEVSYERLLQTLDPGHPAARWAMERRQLNRDLRLLRRETNKGISGPTMVPVLDVVDGKVTVVGECTKEEAHRPGSSKLHATSICLYRWPNGDVVYYQRQPWQSFPGLLDFFGGHMETRDETPLGNCIREANEEVQLFVFDDRIGIDPSWIRQVGPAYLLEWPIDGAPSRLLTSQPNFVNRERSTLFVIRMPLHGGIEIRAGDDDVTGKDYRSIPLDCIRHAPLAELSARKDECADGAYRVLHKYSESPELASLIDHALR